MIYILEEGYYDEVHISEVYSHPDDMDTDALGEEWGEWTEQNRVPQMTQYGKPYKDQRTKPALSFYDWLVKYKGFKRERFRII